VILKLSPDVDYVDNAKRAAKAGVSGLTAINTVKALRLDPRTGRPLLANRFGGLSGRAIKPIGLRVVAELRDAGITLPVIASGGIRTVDDCREYFWAGADAVSLGSEVWLAPYWGYALGPLRGLQIRRVIRRVEGYDFDFQGRGARARSRERGGAAGRLSAAIGSAQQLLHR
jgi:dihydroorotate dehydrogenase (NAD+) catalytic subunit